MHRYLLGFMVLLVCIFSEVSLYPSSNNEKVQYLPFYGGAKGQFLEIKKNNQGTVTSEKIVPGDKLTIDNNKYTDNENESVSVRILTKNLYNLKHASSDLLKIVIAGKKTGSLNNLDKARFKTLMATLGESVSNIIKVMDGVGDDDINTLFHNNDTYQNDHCSHRHSQEEGQKHRHVHSSIEDLKEKSLNLRRFKDQSEEDEEDVGEEGIGVDAEDSGGYDDDADERGLIAEAKPFGLAVIGDHGIAAARPIGTAVAASGVAIAKPIGTAIAGIDPAALGIDFHINELHKH